MSIAAYADPELPLTMMSLLSAAERPELIHFGIAARQRRSLFDHGILTLERSGVSLGIPGFTGIEEGN